MAPSQKFRTVRDLKPLNALRITLSLRWADSVTKRPWSFRDDSLQYANRNAWTNKERYTALVAGRSVAVVQRPLTTADARNFREDVSSLSDRRPGAVVVVVVRCVFVILVIILLLLTRCGSDHRPETSSTFRRCPFVVLALLSLLSEVEFLLLLYLSLLSRFGDDHKPRTRRTFHISSLSDRRSGAVVVVVVGCVFVTLIVILSLSLSLLTLCDDVHRPRTRGIFDVSSLSVCRPGAVVVVVVVVRRKVVFRVFVASVHLHRLSDSRYRKNLRQRHELQLLRINLYLRRAAFRSYQT